MRPSHVLIIFLIFIFFPIELICRSEISPVRADTAQAAKYVVLGNEFFNSAQYDSAMHYFVNAGNIYTKILDQNKNPDLYGKYIHILTCIGKNYIRQMNFEQASEYLKSALALAHEKLEANHIRFAFTYTELATLAFRQSDLKKALEYDKKSLEIKIQNLGKVHHKVADGYYNIGLTYQDLGDYDAALSSFIQSRDIFLKLNEGNTTSIASALYGIGSTYMFKGRYEQAFDPLNEAVTIRLNHLGKDHPLVAEVYHSVGQYYLATGDLDKAIDYNKRSVSIYSQFYGTEHPSVAYGNNNIGTVCFRRGRLDEALHYFDLALKGKIHIFGENHPSVANTYANIGQVYFDQGEYNKAFQQYEKSLKIRFNTLGEHHPSVVIDYIYIGTAHSKMADYDQALDYFNKALSIQLEITEESHPIACNIYNNIGQIWLTKKACDRALAFFQKSLICLSPAFNDTSIYNNPPLSHALNNQMLLDALHYKAEALNERYINRSGNADDLNMALQTYQLASDLIDQMRNGYQAEGSRLFLGEKTAVIFEEAIRTAVRLYKMTGDTRYKETAFQFAEKGKFSTLALNLQDIRSKQFAGIPDSLLGNEKSLRADLAFYSTQLQKEKQKKISKDSLRISDYEEKLFTLNNQYQKLIDTFERDYPKYYDLKYRTETISVQDLQQILDDESVLVEYFTGDETVTIFTVTKTHLNILQVDIDPSFYNLAVSLIKAINKMEVKSFLNTSNQLYETLITPIKSKIEDKNHIIIIPHGILSKIPFEVLINKFPEGLDQIDFTDLNYLIRSYDITYHFSATLFADHVKIRKNKNTVYTFAGFAPIFSDNQDGGYILNSRASEPDSIDSGTLNRSVRVDGKQFKELKYSEKEVREIVHQFEMKNKTAVGYFGKNATEDNLKSAGHEYQFIHLASHGIVNEEFPKLSGILFSQTGQSGGEDGILYAGEIYNLNLNADLVVLSSCESGIGKLVKGEGLLSLTRGFIYAGADNLIVSLWKVSDKHTSELMTELYTNMLNGQTYSTSLRNAKLKMIRNAGTAFPKSWASFVLIGQ